MAFASAPSSGGRRGRRMAMSDINVTPLVDVVLVLLIIFMVGLVLLIYVCWQYVRFGRFPSLRVVSAS